MSDTIALVARELNKVASYDAARKLAGAALSYVNKEAYPVIPKVPSELRTGYRKNLDNARFAVETHYRNLPTGNAKFDKKAFQPLRTAIEKLYNETAAIQGAASYVPKTTFSEILADEAKSVVKSVAKAGAEAANVVGETAGSAIGGILSGIGIWGIAVLVGVFLFYRKAGRSG